MNELEQRIEALEQRIAALAPQPDNPGLPGVPAWATWLARDGNGQLCAHEQQPDWRPECNDWLNPKRCRVLEGGYQADSAFAGIMKSEAISVRNWIARAALNPTPDQLWPWVTWLARDGDGSLWAYSEKPLPRSAGRDYVPRSTAPGRASVRVRKLESVWTHESPYACVGVGECWQRAQVEAAQRSTPEPTPEPTPELPAWAKWVARDANGRLFVYELRPVWATTRAFGTLSTDETPPLRIGENLFPEVVAGARRPVWAADFETWVEPDGVCVFCGHPLAERDEHTECLEQAHDLFCLHDDKGGVVGSSGGG